MKIRFAAVAACLGAFALAQAGLAQAGQPVTFTATVSNAPAVPNHAVSAAYSGNSARAGRATTFTFYKIDSAHTAMACMENMGVVVSKNGKQSCKSQTPIKGWIELSSF